MEEKFQFQILQKERETRARLGLLKTAHGLIKTPAFVPVGTLASVKSLGNQELEEIGTQVFFVNTYHLYLRPGLKVVRSFGGIHQFCGWKKALMSDSAGFQIFSLGEVNRKRRLSFRGEDLEAPLVKINSDGVIFRSHLDGSEHFFTPEKSIEIQTDLGTDIMIAFDECTFYPATYDYAKEALERTHLWAKRCLEENQRLSGKRKYYQALYGVVQGGIFEDLRKKSASFISNLNFDGIAIGGVSVGESKEEMRKVLRWVIPGLPEEKPRHLLGVGEIDDIFSLVEEGVDTFDCVMPTRLGRMGHLLVKDSKLKDCGFTVDITKAEFAEDSRPIDETCDCFVCKNYHRAYLHHLFRTKELLAYRLATYHNLYFLERLLKQIRQAIEEESLLQLRKKWLGE